MSTTTRFVVASAAVAEVRSGSIHGREYVVVPVIAAVGGIAITALGSSGTPELVPAEELDKSVFAWNGRPIVLNHPVDDTGNPISANAPEVMDRLCIGTLFGVRLEDSKLKGEAWIDPELVTRVGDSAQAVLDRIRAKEMVEVSVGCKVHLVEASGEDVNGRAYSLIWTNIIPDHLAFLAVGEVGACSNKAGCGAPRAALRAANRINRETENMNVFQRLIAKLRIGNEESGPSDNDLRYNLFDALHATEPAFDGIVAIYAESGTVIYSVAPNGDYGLRRRGFTAGENGKITLADDVEEVESRVEFVAVKPAESTEDATAAATTAPAETPAPLDQSPAAASCPCGGSRNAADITEGGSTMTNKDLVERLIACKGSPFTEEDRANLESFPTARLTALVEGLTGEPKPKEEPPAPTPRTAEQWMAEAPEDVRAIVSRYQTEEKVRHATLVSVLKGAQQAYDEEELKAMTVPQLTKVATLVGIVDPATEPSFEGRVVPDVRGAGERKDPPRPLTLALEKRRASNAAN